MAMTSSPRKTYIRLFGAVAAFIIVGTACILISSTATGTPAFGAATGQPCAACHVRPDGGPDLTDFGKKFQANGNKLPKM
jgi:hypothetical protein